MVPKEELLVHVKNRRVSMASGTNQSVTTKKMVLDKVRKKLDCLTTKQANVIRMLHGIDEDETDLVGSPPTGCSIKTIEKVREIELQLLARIRELGSDEPQNAKQRIIDKLKKH
jgi:DNA-directed RNA polymerase sigma subunit (sigma70/sigma32)